MAGSHNINSMSPRQRMINLMYIVLTAMLALNVSSDVLNGFNQVEGGLNRSNQTASERNMALFQQLQDFHSQNPEKGGVWYEKAVSLTENTRGLYEYIDSLKILIVRAADGKSGDVNDIRNKDDLESASVIMLSATSGKGKVLRGRIDEYRTYLSSMIEDTTMLNNINSVLSTKPFKVKNSIGNKSWEESMFENMPVVAAVTLLTKMQNDVRYAEGEVLNNLIKNIDIGDIRVNEVNAFVIPNSRIVMRGGKYSANIVLAAVDTTQRPVVYINGKELDNNRGLYEVNTGSSGTFDYNGYLEVPKGDGSLSRYDFKSNYTVIDPMATISATMMNVLYAGINNPISIAVPGVPNSALTATMTNGTLTRSGDGWIALPSKVGAEAVLTVSATMDGRSQTVGSTTFRVRKLPDPMPYIPYNDEKGNPERFKGGRPFPKALLLQAQGVAAAIDDDMLNVAYRVISFETVFFDSMGNAMPEVSNGSEFSPRQKESFKRLSRGKRFYISRMRAIGPDGIERTIAPLEVIVN